MTEETTRLAPGDPVPDFDLPASGGRRVSLAALRGKAFVLYFYPKADTSGCTQEAKAFQELLDGSVSVVGVSKDPMKAIDAFAQKYALSFPLASDETGALLEAAGVWVEKSMYGKRYMGIERTTYLIGPDGRVAQAWNKVKVPGHAAAVMEALKAL
ncbi:peroxiredoxin [Lichenicoccus sp.]|uniref:peroxiredoxin n=1 Tax=Lichenicoccus sp. TaxID=2781899 RepID=UPI003D1036A8